MSTSGSDLELTVQIPFTLSFSASYQFSFFDKKAFFYKSIFLQKSLSRIQYYRSRVQLLFVFVPHHLGKLVQGSHQTQLLLCYQKYDEVNYLMIDNGTICDILWSHNRMKQLTTIYNNSSTCKVDIFRYTIVKTFHNARLCSFPKTCFVEIGWWCWCQFVFQIFFEFVRAITDT